MSFITRMWPLLHSNCAISQMPAPLFNHQRGRFITSSIRTLPNCISPEGANVSQQLPFKLTQCSLHRFRSLSLNTHTREAGNQAGVVSRNHVSGFQADSPHTGHFGRRQ